MRFRCVVFDLDGTLVDSYQALRIAVNRTLAHESRPPLTSADVKRLVGEGVEVLLERCFDGEAATSERMDRFHSAYDEVCEAESVLLHDVELTLQTLGKMNVTMAVCTNKPTHFSEKILLHLGLQPMFDAIVGPDVAGARKPDPRHLSYTIERSGAEAKDVLFVGDMPVDVSAARACGVPVAVVATGSSTREELLACDPDFFLDRFDELPDLVRGDS